MTSVTLALRHVNGTLKRLDRVLLAIALIFAGLALLAPHQVTESLSFTGRSLLSIAPFFVLSVFTVAFARASGADAQVARVFSGRPLTMIALAAAFGALSPFCSCGVIPIIAGLLGAGVPLAPVMAFWISSPLMSPDMFILTGAVLGVPFAIARTLAALGMGLMAGYLTHAVRGRWTFADPLQAGVTTCRSCGGPKLGKVPAVTWRFWREAERRATFRDEARATGWFLLRWLTLAFVIESLMLAYIPADSVSGWLGHGAWWAIPASVAVGVPAYLNGFAAIPTVSALIDMGMIPGAALAFMVAGGVTSVPAAMAVFPLVKRPVFLWYLMLGLVGSLLAGLAYQAVA